MLKNRECESSVMITLNEVSLLCTKCEKGQRESRKELERERKQIYTNQKCLEEDTEKQTLQLSVSINTKQVVKTNT